MALPPGFLDELRARVPISRIVGRRVSWDRRKSNAARGDFWACCPFHEEKSPSFHVDDRKGFYHCFGCHANGDAITFLRESENLGFMEAVEALAREAGLAMPAQDPAAAERAAARRGLADWMEAAVAFYRAQLQGARAAAARAYLAGRGLSPAIVARFEIGYAPPGGALSAHLAAKGAPAQALLDAGLTGRPEDGGAPYDRFRDRVVFPIRDAQGLCVGFGARALGPNAKPKYLNSPETALFDKSRTLFNVGPARAAAARAGALVAAEGYMDVVALVAAGIEHAVAPLGTAITPTQLEMMWRLADEPTIALDGDAAGLGAAARVIDTALPLLAPGRSLRFATMPPDLDPDDVIRAEGPGAMRALLDAARPLVDMLWRRETEGRPIDSPERRAALDARLREVLAAIKDPTVRSHYRDALAERRAALFGPARRDAAAHGAPGRDGRWRREAQRTGGMPQTAASALGRARAPGAEGRGREAAVLLALLRRPDLAVALADEVAAAEFHHADLDRLRADLISAVALGGSEIDLAAALGGAAVGRLEREVGASALFANGAPEVVETGLRETLARLAAETTRRREATDAERAMGAEPGAELDGRLARAAALAETDGKGRLAPDDADESHLTESLRAAITGQIWIKKRRGRTDSGR